MRERMLADEERSEQAFEEQSLRIALEAHEDRLKLWQDVELLTRERDEYRDGYRRLSEIIENRRSDETSESLTSRFVMNCGQCGEEISVSTSDDVKIKIGAITCVCGHRNVVSTPEKAEEEPQFMQPEGGEPPIEL